MKASHSDDARSVARDHAARAVDKILRRLDVTDEVKSERRKRLLCEPDFVERAKLKRAKLVSKYDG